MGTDRASHGQVLGAPAWGRKNVDLKQARDTVPARSRGGPNGVRGGQVSGADSPQRLPLPRAVLFAAGRRSLRFARPSLGARRASWEIARPSLRAGRGNSDLARPSSRARRANSNSGPSSPGAGRPAPDTFPIAATRQSRFLRENVNSFRTRCARNRLVTGQHSFRRVRM